MLFIEIILSIHCLLFFSAWFIKRSWLARHPSFKLKLLRCLLVSCVISPLIVHCIGVNNKPELLQWVSLDSMQQYAIQPLKKIEHSNFASTLQITAWDIPYTQLICLLFGIVVLWRAGKMMLSLRNLHSLLQEAVQYRRSNKLVIKISSRCHIPFSVYFFNKAYIVLPLSLLASTKDVKIAIAHEGQHHRNGDCLWAYFIECLRVVFFGNPGVKTWHQALSDLQEFSCDEVLVGQPKFSAHDYGHCLFKVVQTVSQCSLSNDREFACTVGMALSNETSDSTLLIRRITMLSNYPLNASKPKVLGLAFAGFSVVAPLCVAYSAAGSLTSQAKEELALHIDPKIQAIASEEITAAVNRYQAKSGVIAIADPASGKLIAFAEAGKTVESWKSRVFPPASTIKPFIAAAAIEAGTSSEAKTYECNSPYTVAGRTFTNNTSNGGPISLTEALVQSDNVCFIKVAEETGAATIRKKLAEFGFDTNTWWSKNQHENLALVSVGENIPVTVGSLTKSFAKLANNDKSVISDATANSITHMLEKVVENGTGKNAAIPGVAVAGKTGTLVEPGTNGTQLALFGGYVPANSPRYVVLVLIENGHLTNGQKAGGALAAPVFHNVVVKSLEIAKQ